MSNSRCNEALIYLLNAWTAAKLAPYTLNIVVGIAAVLDMCLKNGRSLKSKTLYFHLHHNHLIMSAILNFILLLMLSSVWFPHRLLLMLRLSFNFSFVDVRTMD